MYLVTNTQWKLVSLIFLFAFTSAIKAQTFRGGINGTIADSSGALVSGAAILAVEASTNASYNAISSTVGEFNFTNLPIGGYTVTISSPGFSTSRYDKVQVAAGVTYTLPVTLAISSSAQTVEVTAAALTLDTTTDTQATVLPETVVQNLPNSGRDFTQMLTLT